jgi:hypothetical protein
VRSRASDQESPCVKVLADGWVVLKRMIGVGGGFSRCKTAHEGS